MSRTQYAPKQSYIGTGSLAVYSFDFKIEVSTQLEVVEVNDLGVETQRVRGNDTSYLSGVTFDSVNGGGEITLATNLPSNYKLVLLLANDEPTQTYEFSNKNSFSLKRIERALDFITGPIQRLAFRGRQAFRIHDADDETAFNPQLPPGIASQNKRTIVINDDADGMTYGPTTDEIANAQGYALGAATSEQNALISEQNAAASENAAELSAEDALESEQNAEFWSGLLLFDQSSRVDDEDSPVTTELATDGTLFLTNATSDDVEFTLPALATVGAAWKIGVIKTSGSANFVIVTPDGTETINGQPSFSYTDRDVGAIFFKNSETDWSVKIFTFGESQSGGSLIPAGGAEGAAFVKNSATDGDAIWDDLAIEGFSARFNQAWSSAGLRDTLLKILNISYLAPLVSLSGSSQTLREKGDTVSSITLSANVTKRSDDIARIRFLQGATEIADNNPPSNTGSGVTTAPYNTPFSDNITFTVQVTDDGTQGGPTQVNANTTYNFVYPYYYGADVPSISAAAVAALTKNIINSNANLLRNFTAVDGDVYYFAYPTSYGALSSILDENNFETIGAWTLRTESITGLDGNPVSYRIYEFNNPVTAGTTNFTFIR